MKKSLSVIWYGNNEGMYRGWWDMAMLEYFFRDATHYEGMQQLEQGEGAVVIIPGRALAGKELQVQKDVNLLPWCVLIVAGDEEGIFDSSKIVHPSMFVWIQNPIPNKNDTGRRIGCGYTPHVGAYDSEVPSKNLDFFFAGQITHSRRLEMAQSIQDKTGGLLYPTTGFTKGMPQKEYCGTLARAKVVPCPSGPQTPDTFRIYEALEFGAIPIADEATPKEDWAGFWTWLFGDSVPFPVLTNYSDLPGYIDDCVTQYPKLNNRVQAWWQRYKVDLQNRFFDDIALLSNNEAQDTITVVIPVSPIPSHPSTDIIEETIKSIRYHLPESEIIVTFDGVRQEQEHMRESYEEHIRCFLWKCRKWGKVTPYIFDEHKHQSGMMRFVIDTIKTPLIMYVEQDTPIVTDEPIDWDLIKKALLSGRSNTIRLHHEGVIPQEHLELIIGKPEDHLLKTVQWSQRPHISSTAFYRRIMAEEFTKNSKCFIEDLMHGRVMQAFNNDGEQGWNQWRLHIYFPDKKNIKRSYHNDGRQGGEKYDTNQKW